MFLHSYISLVCQKVLLCGNGLNCLEKYSGQFYLDLSYPQKIFDLLYAVFWKKWIWILMLGK